MKESRSLEIIKLAIANPDPQIRPSERRKFPRLFTDDMGVLIFTAYPHKVRIVDISVGASGNETKTLLFSWVVLVPWNSCTRPGTGAGGPLACHG